LDKKHAAIGKENKRSGLASQDDFYNKQGEICSCEKIWGEEKILIPIGSVFLE
jgi:hypothetical protein